MAWAWGFGLIFCFLVLSYQRASLYVWTLALAIFLALMLKLTHASYPFFVLVCAVFVIVFFPLYASRLRYRFFTKHVLALYRKKMPTMSTTEREALTAGSITWEGDLFSGNPNWNKLLHFPKPALTSEEKAFIEGPVEELCKMINDWDIVHNRSDLPPKMWEFLKKEGFFSLIITKEYGGKEFSAYAHSQILIKVYGHSTTVGSTIAVPNSLGPAELLLHYGTPEQKNYYLPRLARGEEVPCFALTGLEAGSDAGAMTDKGIVAWGEFEGKKILGLRLNWNKRYITLAPIATVIGLAFKMYDPDHLLGQQKNLGITCALIPRNTPGITIGRRHLPSGCAFQNGPTQGKDVFIPLDWIIGGPAMAGLGWRMLMECLAAGRAISLPAGALGGAKALTFAAGAYARVRRQFKIPIGRFEGIEEVLARIAGYTYIMDATRTLTVGMIDLGEKPAVASAITKYHVTEFGRMVANDGMDLHGGKGIMLGPHNYIGFGYQSVPVAITVEGANILTRNMIIFGQGAMRCHPYVFAEFNAALMTDDQKSVQEFDKALMGHMSFTISNLIRTLVLGLTSGRLVYGPRGKMKRYFQQATRFCSAFAMLADIALMVLGGSLKRRENISARLGDILSYLYLLSAVLKHFSDQGRPEEDLPLVRFSLLYCLYQIQQRFDDLLKNFPNRTLAVILRFIIFPFGMRFSYPSDRLHQAVAHLILSPTATRDRLAEGAFLTSMPSNMLSVLEDALQKVIACEAIEKIIKAAVTEGLIKGGDTVMEQAIVALSEKVITKEQFDMVYQAEEARKKVIAVDDFAPEDLIRANVDYKIKDTYATTAKE